MAKSTDRERAYARDYYQRNSERVKAQAQAYKRANRESLNAYNLRVRHGQDVELWRTLTLRAQGYRCYLCRDRISTSSARIDHDHKCCPPLRSCPACRRGLACNNCNASIGFAKDDPKRLRRMADALERANADLVSPDV